jgi:tRNA dimethylallyltransferase
MKVLSQQPTQEQLEAVPHHLIGCVEPTESFNVGQYRRLALKAIDDIHSRKGKILLVGGTGLYLKSLTEGLSEAPPANPKLRAELWTVAQNEGSHILHERLQKIDPQAATKIHSNDAKRLVRALEVYATTGRPMSSFWQWGEPGQSELEIQVIGLDRDRAELYERINMRVIHMIEKEQVIEEAKRVLALTLSDTACTIHGLPFLQAYIKGERTLDQTISLWQQQVRNYAKRQLIWFRGDPKIKWVQLNRDDSLEGALEKVISVFEKEKSESSDS